MNETETIERFSMQTELEIFLLDLSVRKQLEGLPEDFIFDLMLNVGMGTWFNLLHTALTVRTKE